MRNILTLRVISFYYSSPKFFFNPFKASSTSGYLGHFSIIYVNSAFYIFGGHSSVKDIGRLDGTTMIWSKAGELTKGRWGHNAIYDGSSVLVVGGVGTFKTEKCTISNNQVTCTEQNPELVDYRTYPELFMVPVDFCKTLP